MKTSDNALRLLASDDYEGCVLHVYKDAAGLPTIGVGHLLTSLEKAQKTVSINGAHVSYTNGITMRQALDLLAQDVKSAEDTVNSHIKLPLTQNQFDALVIFTFNIGVGGFNSSSVLADFNQADLTDIPADMRKWNKITDPVTKQHIVCDGLVKRRELEIKLFETA